MEIHEIAKKAKGTDAAKAETVDALMVGSNMSTVAGVMLGFYLYDAIYSVDYQKIIGADRSDMLKYINGFSGAVLANIVFAIITAIAIEQYPAHLYVRGFWATWKRSVVILVFGSMAIFFGFGVGSERSVFLLLCSFALYGTSAAGSFHKARTLKSVRRESR